MLNLSESSSSYSYINGMPITSNESIVNYNGDEMFIARSNNGDISYHTLDNEDIYNIFMKKNSDANLEDRIKTLLNNRPRKPRKSKKAKSAKKVKSAKKAKSDKKAKSIKKNTSKKNLCNVYVL